eukprot:TRINITY_DN530_c0_g2_i1.p2 TRINITY_DN530_c0_g2~~TRINITY_DN530_c0_g2_i1.p2  ORF type:complete len:552 (-),score=41.53 TRINITY_DN530_c0_g2_i1:346-2001(-)
MTAPNQKTESASKVLALDKSKYCFALFIVLQIYQDLEGPRAEDTHAKVQHLHATSLKVSPLLLQSSHRFLLNKPNVSNIARDSSVLDFKWRLLLLDESTDPAKSLPGELQKVLTENQSEVELKEHEVKLDYSSLDYYQVLRHLLPIEIEVPQPLERVGHIACFYLTSQQYLYREIVAQVYLDKYPDVKTVVNRGYNPIVNSIVTELIGGEENTQLKIKEENGTELTFDYIKSNYTTRMEEEHKRILHYVNMNHTVCDLVADCGAVTVRAAKKGCRVISNCESPGTYEYLQKNIETNIPKKGDKVKAYSMKTVKFIKALLGSETEVAISEDFKRINVIYINDYFNALEYIKEILVAIKAQCENILNNIWSVRNLPKIYFYYSGAEKSTKSAIIEKLKQTFSDAGCGADTFDERCIIGIKANRYIYPDICLHCVYVRIPAAAVFSKDYMDMYGSQELLIPNPGSICSLSIGDTLELMDEMKIPPRAGEISGKRTVPEAKESEESSKDADKKKSKEEQLNNNQSKYSIQITSKRNIGIVQGLEFVDCGEHGLES